MILYISNKYYLRIFYGRLMCVIDAWISSRVRLLVSGTTFTMNKNPTPHMAEYMKNVPEIVSPEP